MRVSHLPAAPPCSGHIPLLANKPGSRIRITCYVVRIRFAPNAARNALEALSFTLARLLILPTKDSIQLVMPLEDKGAMINSNDLL